MIAAARWVALALGLATSAAGVEAQATDSARSPLRKRSTYEDLQMFSQALNQIRVNHPDSIDTHDLYIAAVDGMVRAADPHSYVIPAVRLDTAKQRALADGKLHPVPIDFRFVGGTATIVSVAPGTKTARQDILPGDVLVGIEGKPVRAQSVTELEVTLAGPRNSRLTLELERLRVDGSLMSLERVVVRERSGEQTAVPAAFMLDTHTGYVRITTFDGDRVANELRSTIQKLETAGMNRLLLDLRGNGGGLVSEAAKIAGEFLPKGAIVYTTEGRKSDVIDTGRVSRSFWGTERRYPVVLLVDAGTASASELLAGALQDHDRAVIVGRPTFGKALVMRGFPMTDGSVIVLVVGQLRTPCGRIVQRQYQEITRSDYYRLSASERDTAGRPSCRTTKGRTVYGGGGIYPDIVLERPKAPPLWVAEIRALDLPRVWAGAWVTANDARFPTADALAASPALPPEALAEFRELAATKGVRIPEGSDPVLQRMLVGAVAYARFGDAGFYRVDALLDPDVSRAALAFGRATELMGTK